MSPDKNNHRTSWSMCAILSIMALLYLRLQSSWVSNGQVEEWLQENNLKYLEDVVTEAGGTSLPGVLQIMKTIQNKRGLYTTLTKEQHYLLEEAVKKLIDKLELEYWATEIGLAHALPIFLEHDMVNFNLLCQTESSSLRNILMSEGHFPDDTRMFAEIDKVCQDPVPISSATLVEFAENKGHSSSHTLGKAVFLGLLVLSLTMLLSGYTSVSNVYHRAVPSLYQRAVPSSKTIFEFFTGRFSTPHHSKVIWDWTEPQTVGKTMTFAVRFFNRSGAPYPVSDRCGVLIEILHEGVKMAHTCEFASADKTEDVNLVRCGFTVHKSGKYTISILVGGHHIKESPFTKTFDAGPIDPAKTGFTHYSSTVVVPAGTSHPLVIEPRDSFGNLTAYKTDHKAFFKIKVTESDTGERYSPTTQIVYSSQEKQLVMCIRMEKEGCFQASVSYGDVKLKNGEFDILVLNSRDLSKVHRNVAKRKHNLWFEARLLSQNGDHYDRPKKVYVYVSPKQLTVKEYYFKIYPKKLCTFRVCPRTKFVFSGLNNGTEMPLFWIEDGSQPSIQLAAKERSTIVATFSCFLLKSIGGSETFNDKRNFFYQEIRLNNSARSSSSVNLKVDREHLLASSHKATKSLSPSDWRHEFNITFDGEPALDWGGVSREWFEVLCKELFDPNCSKLFTRLTDSSQGLVHPNPNRPPDKKLKLYEFAGKIVGKCLFDSSVRRTQLVKAKFTRSFLAQLIGLRVTYKHFSTDEPEFYQTKISYIENNDVEDMELTFSEEVYGPNGQLVKVVDLIPNGSRIAVTNSNKLQYLDALAQYRLVTPIKEEVDAFMRGLTADLIPENLLSIFDEYELELLMCGTGTFSISDFKQHHTVGVAPASFNKVREWFWTIIASFTDEQMARLLQFITGCSQLPPGGFAELDPKIKILMAPTANNLPSSHTCFNQLCLPDYDDMETFHRMLLIAINEGNQGFGMA